MVVRRARDDGSGSPDERWIVETVRKFADQAGIGMPEVGIFEGDPNAFATGAFKNNALVAVSTGLLQGMTREEIEAVIGTKWPTSPTATW
jgi:heat shock protein HtpX